MNSIRQGRRYSSRKKLSIAAVAATAGLALLLSACAPVSDDDGDAAESAGPTTVLIGVGDFPPGQADPYAGTLSGGPVKSLLPAIFDRLVVVAETGIEPALATSWAETAPGEWEFSLREGVSFSNGEAFDAATVKAVFDYLLEDEEGKAKLASTWIKFIEEVVVQDSQTVKITSSVTGVDVPRELSQIFMVPPKYFAEVGSNGFAAKPVGTGPYEVTSFGANEVDLVLFEGSWRDAEIDNIKYIKLPDPTSRVQALQSGQIDVALDVPVHQAEILASGGFTIESARQGSVYALQYVNAKGDTPIASQKVRQALNYAIDRDTMMETIFGGLATAANQGASEGAAGHVSSLSAYEYNPEKAKALLAEAGYPDGFDLEIQISGQGADAAAAMTVVASDLAKVGIKAEVEALPFAQWLKNYQTNSFSAPAFGIGYTSQPTLDTLRTYEKTTCAMGEPFWCHPGTLKEELYSAAANAASPKDRQDALEALTAEYFLNPPALYLWNMVEVTARSSTVSGYGSTPMGGIDVDALRITGN